MFDESALSPIDVTSSAWALATTRMILRDTSDPERFTDAELTAALALRTFTRGGTTYYRPHAVAAALVRSDPDRAISESIDNASETRPDPAQVASGIVREYANIDDLIEAASGYRPTVGQRFRVTF